MEPCTTDRQPDPSTMDPVSSPTAADPAAETHPQADDDDDKDADSLFDGKTPAFESQTQSPAQAPPEDQDSHESHSEPPSQPDGRPETQPQESQQQQQQTQPACPNPSSDGNRPLTGNSSTPSDSPPNTHTTATNGPPTGPHTDPHPRPAPSTHPNGIYGHYAPPPPDPGPKPMPPAPAVHGPFTYDKGGFKALGFKRETPYNLHMIMRDPNAVPPIEPVAKAWFHAQLIHYGIPVHQSAPGAEPLPGDLFYALQTALFRETIKEGKLPPADILAIEDNLTRQFKDINKQYKEAFTYWEQQTFARCATPTDEINCSVDLFMAKYFLDNRGQPDRWKTRYPIILHKLNDYDGTRQVVKAIPRLRSHMMPLWSVICWEWYGIERAIEEAFASIAASHPSITIHVPTMEAHFHIDYFLSKYFLTGLHGRPMPFLTQEPIVIEGWFGGPDIRNILTHAVLRVPDLRVWAFIGNGIDKTVIGWGDRPFEVIEQLRETSMRQQVANTAPQRVEIQGNPTWELALQPHFRLCQVKADLLRTNPQQVYKPFEIEELVGSWLIQCPALEDGGWGGRPGEMTIDILNWPVDSYGLVASINLKVALGTMILAKSEQLLEELSAYLLHDPEVLPRIPHQKRRRGDDFYVEYPRRRSPYDPMPPVRIFFDWIGRRAGEFDVELDMDPTNRNRGWVDIDMNNKSFGKGWLKYAKFFGRDNPVAFSMYKVMDQPRKMPEQWSNFRPKQMEAQLQRRMEEQLQRPIAQPKEIAQPMEIMITSKIPPPASDHTLPPLPPPRAAPPPRLAPPSPPRPPSPPKDLPGFQRIRPRDSEGIQIGMDTNPPKKRRGPKKGYNRAPYDIVVHKQGNGVPREGGDGKEERNMSASTPIEGEGHVERYGSEEEEEGRQEGEQRDDASPDDANEQAEEEQGQTQNQEQEEGRKGQGEGADKKTQEDQGQEHEDEDGLETYETPAEEAPSAPDANEQQNDGNGRQEHQEGQERVEDDQEEEEEEEQEEKEEDKEEQEQGTV
ncbi:hypothetical protein QR685DRAFT_148138 [Neurospora intermedia]|uniref:Uncharacterized protein n=1 Tax=Neurospora intermedia TaxID=5142 RepID=A0ABR3CXC0_NEUIN